MLVHVPFAELANMKVAFEVILMETAVYGIERGEVIYFVKPGLGEGEEWLVRLIQGTQVRVTFHDDTRSTWAYGKTFGHEALQDTQDLTPESLGISSRYGN
jgi:hypothetical protein